MDKAWKDAFDSFLKLSYWPEVKMDDDKVGIVIDNCPSFQRVLILKNVEGFPKEREGYFCQNLSLVFLEADNRYCMQGEFEDFMDETIETFAFTFESAEVEIEVYNACQNFNFWDSPWNHLRTISWAIGMKAELPGDYCNAKEKELLPLIREINALDWLEASEREKQTFDVLKQMVMKYDFTKVGCILKRLEQMNPKDDNYYKTVDKLGSMLCKKKYEPLWREIYQKFCESQMEYSNHSMLVCENELLVPIRRAIQEYMEYYGYEGKYPDFVKKGEVKGIHLEKSYGMTYLIGMEMHVEHHMHCSESLEDGYLTIQFLCGTAFLKAGEKSTDIYDCLFDAKGKRIFHTVHYSVALQENDDTKTNDLKTTVTIAVKKAECMRLNKEEQQLYYGRDLPGWRSFWVTFLMMGAFFDLAFCFIGVLLCVNLAAIFDMFSEIPEMLSVIPWGPALIIGWIGFGGGMGIVEVLAKRK